MVQVGFGLGDLLFLLDLAAYLTLFFIAKGWTIDWNKRSLIPFLATFLFFSFSTMVFVLGPSLGLIAFFAAFVGFLIYAVVKAEDFIGFFYNKSFLLVASLPLIITFFGVLLMYLAGILSDLATIPWLLLGAGIYLLFFAKGILVALIVWTLEKADINRFWALAFGIFGYIGLLFGVLIAKQRGKL